MREIILLDLLCYAVAETSEDNTSACYVNSHSRKQTHFV